MFWVDSDKPRCRKQSGGRPRPNRKPDARQGNNACGHPSWLRRPTIVGRIAYQAEFTVAFEGTADMGLTSAHRNSPFMTRSGGKPGRNLAAQKTPDLMLANPLCCPSD
jgi:hypothetical protein